MKLRLTPRAATELSELLSYIEQENPQAAFRVAGSIEHIFELLCDMPTLGKPSLRAETREYTIPRLPLIIVYRPQDNDMVILSVFHTARDPRRKP